MRFRFVPKSTILDNLEGHYYALCFNTRASFGAHHENFNEDREPYTISDEDAYSPMTLVSGNTRFMQIFAGIP